MTIDLNALTAFEAETQNVVDNLLDFLSVDDIFPTKAAADTAAPTIVEGKLISVLVDETQNDDRTLYRKEGGNLVLKYRYDFLREYIGKLDVDPVTNNEGGPVVKGDIYYNTTDNVVKFYDGAAWVSPEQVASQAASNALASEQAAALSEANALTSETNAAASAAQAELLFDQFGDQYLGPLANDPLTDNDGDPLTEGDIYFNTTDNVLKFYSGTEWVAPEEIATTAAANALASEQAAALSETNAANSEANAATSEAAALASQQAAATSEANALASEQAAALSESNAATSAANAATSEANALASQQAAAASEAEVEADRAEVEANTAQVATDAASASADAASAAQSAADAEQSAADALAAAQASGVDFVYNTDAEAFAATGSFSEGDVVKVLQSERNFGDPATYRFEGGALDLKFTDTTDESFLYEFYNHSEDVDFQVEIPTDAYDYSVRVGAAFAEVIIDWGDGSTTTRPAGNSVVLIHQYALAGSYNITIGGDGIVDELQTAGNEVTNFRSFGRGPIDMNNLQLGAVGGLNLITNNPVMTKNAVGLRTMFRGTDFNLPIGDWDIGNALTMEQTFANNAVFNQDIGSWNPVSVTNFSRTFENASAFDQNLNNWDTSSATNMVAMFRGASVFNSPLDNWDVSNVTSFLECFEDADDFNQDLNNWDTSSATNMSQMFNGADVFNGDVTTWNTGSVTNMSNMFSNAIAFDQNLGSWNVTSLTDATNMFNGVTLSTANYDALLVGWEAQAVQDNVAFGGGNSTYTLGSAAEAARQRLITDHGWIITDGGGV